MADEARVSSIGAQVLVKPESPNARVSSVGAQVLVKPEPPNARVSSVGAQVLVKPEPPNARVSSIGIQVLRSLAIAVPTLDAEGTASASASIVGDAEVSQAPQTNQKRRVIFIDS